MTERPQDTPAQKPAPKPGTQMPKWLLYGFIAKGILVVLIVIGVLWYAGIIG